ncbi:hypothetical protein GCM10011579_049970 [Streptomyces albiflavescens]|uniref:Uncharacterized protein n=1 Tax=Streptomyces albiflavescens TaxID=1623582 RepID=A0A917Y845_9ACTN|nr:hypothetical protein [Streptomyces albiflavescens]GGN72606.1 hypothetical protein GCM10011579_049970 [Streptomyces albiflavescens]
MDDPRGHGVATPAPEPKPAPGTTTPSAGATLLIVAALSSATWWLFIDPRRGVLDVYGNPANAVIFWTLFAIVCLGGESPGR